MLSKFGKSFRLNLFLPLVMYHVSGVLSKKRILQNNAHALLMMSHEENTFIITIKESDTLSITAHNSPGTVENTEYLTQVCRETEQRAKMWTIRIP